MQNLKDLAGIMKTLTNAKLQSIQDRFPTGMEVGIDGRVVRTQNECSITKPQAVIQIQSEITKSTYIRSKKMS
ncbi:MAG: hypothetical protein ABSA92_08760 [Candidatus Bathyarchaeia archaeon]